ncbi:YcxB family protein [Nonomuraea sp. NBC_00507]|uniref:YcxB family protein n=1 Tax=Nonomuraea sp. NBC_00507 TaxID=2976002 RepID=UPI002E1786C1
MTIGSAMFVGAAVSPLVVSWSLRRTGRRRLAFLCVPTTLHLTGDGYKVETEQSTATTRWSLFGPVVTTPEFWLFFVNRQFTGFLPRRAFTDEQQAALDALPRVRTPRSPEPATSAQVRHRDLCRRTTARHAAPTSRP